MTHKIELPQIKANYHFHFLQFLPKILTGAQLLDLVELRAQTVIDPRQHVMPRQIVRRHVG